MERGMTIVNQNANTVNEGSKDTTIVPTGTEPQDSFAGNMALAQQNKSVKTGPSVPPLLPISPAAVDIFPH